MAAAQGWNGGNVITLFVALYEDCEFLMSLHEAILAWPDRHLENATRHAGPAGTAQHALSAVKGIFTALDKGFWTERG